MNQAYCYLPDTKEFCGTCMVQQDPMSPGAWLMPPNSTLVAPGEIKIGQRAVFDLAGNWLVEDIPGFFFSRDAQIAADARKDRDRLLSSCDWTQLGDIGLTAVIKKKYAEYRQALRDLPNTKGFPLKIEWPEKPLK